jgi:hypothetical protein
MIGVIWMKYFAAYTGLMDSSRSRAEVSFVE